MKRGKLDDRYLNNYLARHEAADKVHLGTKRMVDYSVNLKYSFAADNWLTEGQPSEIQKRLEQQLFKPFLIYKNRVNLELS